MGDLSGVLDWGITVDDMQASETKAMLQQMLAYYHQPETAGAVWGPYALQNMFPNFPRCDDPSMTTDALCTETRRKRIDGQGITIIKRFEDMKAVDPMGAIAYLQHASTDLVNDCSPKKVDVAFADAFNRRLYEYDRIARGERVCVATWPWAPIQAKTLGIRDSDYIIFYGRPKSMKSWVLCYLIAWYIGCGLRVLIYTKEMPPDEVFERIGCILAGVDYEHFTIGTLTPEEGIRIRLVNDVLQQQRENRSIICLSGQDARGRDTVMWLEAKVEKYGPHLVAVDGLYLMTPAIALKQRHERIASISQDFRQMILRRRVPGIATVQANRKAAENEDSNTEEVAFSDSLGQDATMLIRIVNEHKRGEETVALVMGGATRRFRLDGFRINALPAYNFSYFGELSAKDAEKAVSNDDKSTGTAKEKKGKKTPERFTRQDKTADQNADRSAAKYGA